MESKNEKKNLNQTEDSSVEEQTLKTQDSPIATVDEDVEVNDASESSDTVNTEEAPSTREEDTPTIVRAHSQQENGKPTVQEQETPTIVDAQSETQTEDTPLDTQETTQSDTTRDEQPEKEPYSEVSEVSETKESKAIIVEADAAPQQPAATSGHAKTSTAKGPGAQIVRADSVQPEEVPTIPIGSLQTINSLEPEVSVHSVASMRATSMPAPLVVQPAEYRRSIGERIDIWLNGMRLKYIPLSLLPVLVGSVLAWSLTVGKNHLTGHLDIIHFIGFIIAIIVMQIGANLINDYYDFQRGVDTSNPLGPGGLIQQGLIKPLRILITGLTFLAIGTVIGLVSTSAGGSIASVITIALALGAYFFSATKFSLSSLGLSELVGFLCFGPLTVIAAYLIQTHGVYSNSALIYSLPLGFLGAAVVHINNLRDVEGDAHAGKHTLASLLGVRLNRVIYTILLLASYIAILDVGVRHGTPHLVLITLWTLPILVVAVTGALRTEISAGFHDVMKQTLKLQVWFSILLIVALIATALIAALTPLPHLLPF